MRSHKVGLVLVLFVLLSSSFIAASSVSQHVIVGSRYISHDAIIIDGNSEFLSMAYSEGWPGSGTVDDPYIIRGYKIVLSSQTVSSTTYGIKVVNVDLSFIIEDCYIEEAIHSIYLSNVRNVEVRGNSLENFRSSGVYILDSKFVEVHNNTMRGTVVDPSYYYYPFVIGVVRSQNIEIHHNSFRRSLGISITNADQYQPRIKNVSVHHNTLEAGSIVGKYIDNISVEYNQLAKDIRMDFSYCTELVIGHNTIPGAYTPIELSYITSININNNTIGPSTQYNVEIEYSSYISLENNTITGSSNVWAVGIRYSENIAVIDNHIDYGDTGISIVKGENVELSGNTVQRFTNQAIIMGNVNNSIVSRNNIVNNNLGIYCYNVSSTHITENLFYNNSDYAYMQSFSPGTNIFIHHNAFINNHGSNDTYNSSHVQAYDSVNLNWSWENKGNYWRDWAENNDTNDQNDDGIVDWPYLLDGGANVKDLYPIKAISFYIAPLQPRNVQAILEAGSVNLTWERPVYEGSEGVSKYVIYRDGAYLTEVPGDRLWYKDMSVKIGNLHTYYIIPSDNYGEGDKSKEIIVSVGIRIDTDAELIELAQNEGLAGDGSMSNPYIIEGYNIDVHGFSDGIYIGNVTLYFIISNCNAHNASVAGIELYNLTHGRVQGCTCSENLNGIYVRYSKGVELVNNTCRNNRYFGILLVNSENNRVEENQCLYNTGSGIRLANASANMVSDNEIMYNENYGIELYGGSDGNIITENRVFENEDYGAYIYDSLENLVYNNTFYNNRGSGELYSSSNVQAYDEGDNMWNTSTRGNYWYDWANNNDTNDQDRDGIVDWAYKIDGGAVDYYPLKSGDVHIPEFESVVWILLALFAVVGLLKKRH